MLSTAMRRMAAAGVTEGECTRQQRGAHGGLDGYRGEKAAAGDCCTEGVDNGRGGSGNAVWPGQAGSRVRIADVRWQRRRAWTTRELEGDVVGGVEWVRGGVGHDECVSKRGGGGGEGEREQRRWARGHGWPTVKVKGRATMVQVVAWEVAWEVFAHGGADDGVGCSGFEKHREERYGGAARFLVVLGGCSGGGRRRCSRASEG